MTLTEEALVSIAKSLKNSDRNLTLLVKNDKKLTDQKIKESKNVIAQYLANPLKKPDMH